MLKIYVEEEYGFRNWVWMFPGSIPELVAEWKAGRAPLNYFDPSLGKLKGEFTEFGLDCPNDVSFYADLDNLRRSADAYIHTHELEDTYLGIGDRNDEAAPFYRHPRIEKLKAEHFNHKMFERDCPDCKH